MTGGRRRFFGVRVWEVRPPGLAAPATMRFSGLKSWPAPARRPIRKQLGMLALEVLLLLTTRASSSHIPTARCDTPTNAATCACVSP